MRTIFIIHDSRGLVGRVLRGAAVLMCLAAPRPAWAQVEGGTSPVAEAPPPSVVPPKLVTFIEAPYPAEAEQARLEATVRLKLTLDDQGAVTEAQVLEPQGHGFDEAARDAALRFRFEPARRDGVAVPSRIAYSYEFRLPVAPEATVVTEAPGQARDVAPEPTAAVEPAPGMPSSPGERAEPPPVITTTPVDVTQEAIDVTVEGESVANRRRRSAESVKVVETENLQREAVDMAQALARTEGVDVRRGGGLGSRARFSLAGLSEDQVRFFIDGVPLELAGFGPDFANVPVNLVQRMELYQGVVPARFGADALGGAVHIVTAENLQRTGASASYELGSFETHRVTASAQHGTASGLFVRASGFFDSSPNDYLVDVKVDDAEGRIHDARLPRFHDAFRAGGGGVEVGVLNRPWARKLSLRVFGSSSTKEVQHDATMSNAYGDIDTSNRSGGATLRFEQLHARDFVVDAVGGYVYRRASLTDLGSCAYDWYGRCVITLPQPGELQSRAIDRRVGQHTAFVRANVGWTFAPNQMLRLAVAPTYVTRAGEDRALERLGQQDPLTGERSLFNLVTGLEHELDALDERLENIAFAKSYVQLARAERISASGAFAPVDRDTFNFGVGDSLRYHVTPRLTAKAAYEWATRLPRPDELFGDGMLIDSNLTLEPETSHNVNLELAFDSGELPTGTFRGGAMGFARLTDRFIIPIGREGYFTYQNVFAARVLGATGAVGWTSPGQYLSLDGNATFQDLRNVSSEGSFGTFEGQRLPNRPSLLANGSARFQLSGLASARDELSLSWHTRFVDTFYRGWEGLGSKDSKMRIPSQLLHSLAITYLTRTARATLSWTVDVRNLTDATAMDFYGVQRPGRSVSAKMVAEL
ncbi:TonB-dependent siderophore myxochelin receptor MxcH [Myxococcus sp. K38C18041901]|uniref:TonB-dependent siderophore myxochelin receptor MxcH n=1 Tax=Myxococcus guangdongensis TaxID=2906760 RepID=UPI0020A75E1C|nr:TonB-dependent siderophore myxochelin receptor MxcH [Myxococcus guangdongensis]MCP3060394.1 TonB-dependent siderophore myxochelin receptor MxcH [Myxococcus guangdongensis]